MKIVFLDRETLDNVVIMPHIAWTSIKARNRLMTGIFKNIKGFINEQK